MKLLLDTSGYVGFKMGLREIVDFLMEAQVLLFPPIVLGELMFGFRLGNRFQKNMEELRQFINQEFVEVVLLGEVTADRYSRIAEQLKRQGTPLPVMTSGLRRRPWSMALNWSLWIIILKKSAVWFIAFSLNPFDPLFFATDTTDEVTATLSSPHPLAPAAEEKHIFLRKKSIFS